MTWPIIIVAALVTSFVSGIFGMAGGLMLMGVLAFLLPVSAAMVVHGTIQSVSNGWRAILWHRWIDWRILGLYLIGSAAAAALLFAFMIRLPEAWLFIVLGLVPGLLWLPLKQFALDARKTSHAVASGVGVTGLGIVAGVSGPLLDVFYVTTDMDRRTVVATKAATQVVAHGFKIAYYIVPAMAAEALAEPYWLLAAIPMAMLGTTLGAQVLKRMSDIQFRNATKWIVTVLGAIYVVRGILLLTTG